MTILDVGGSRWMAALYDSLADIERSCGHDPPIRIATMIGTRQSSLFAVLDTADR